MKLEPSKKEYIKIIRPCIRLTGIQIKSLDAFERLAANLSSIEEVTGIHATRIILEDIFVCPDIVWEQTVLMTPMEELLFNLLGELGHVKGR